MAELKIEIFNQAYVKCITDDLGLQQDLSDFFTFQVPGASFMPSVRARRWDGKIRLYSKAIALVTFLETIFPSLLTKF